MKRKSILLIVLIMAIGFAAVSTTLYINGSSKINPNKEDFDVYFSDAYVNEIQDLSIIVEDRIIEFTTTFEGLGQKYLLDYEVTNGSKNYDAELVMSCTSNSEYLTVTNEFDTDTILTARDSRLGRLTIEQTKSYAGDDIEVTIACTIDANAIERTSLNEEEIQTSGEYTIEGYYMDANNTPLANKNLVIFSDTPHYVTTDKSGYLFYNGLERGSHEVYYVEDTLDNIKLMTKEEIKKLSSASSIFTTRTNNEINFDNGSIISNLDIQESIKYCESIINKEWTFSYTGSEQEFLTRCDGNYKFELWGAQGGGDSSYPGGYGGYVKGNISLEKNDVLYAYVGESGQTINKVIFNNGSRGMYMSWGSDVGNDYAGGGATDIRLVNGEWSNFESLKSRILIAAAGAGSNRYHASFRGGNAGGLSGYNGSLKGSDGRLATGATQRSGGNNGMGSHFGNGPTNGGFGFANTSSLGTSTGGSGYYAGGGGAHGSGTVGSGAGGSSFISGHSGCDAIAESSTSAKIIHTGQANHYSGYVFTNTIMVDGAGYNWTTSKGSYTGMPSHDGTTTISGNTGNGYAKITYLGTN